MVGSKFFIIPQTALANSGHRISRSGRGLAPAALIVNACQVSNSKGATASPPSLTLRLCSLSGFLGCLWLSNLNDDISQRINSGPAACRDQGRRRILSHYTGHAQARARRDFFSAVYRGANFITFEERLGHLMWFGKAWRNNAPRSRGFQFFHHPNRSHARTYN